MGAPVLAVNASWRLSMSARVRSFLGSQFREERRIGREIPAGQTGISAVTRLPGRQQAPAVGQDAVGALVQLQHVVEVPGARLQVTGVGGDLPVAEELGLVRFGQGLYSSKVVCTSAWPSRRDTTCGGTPDSSRAVACE
jgi:hypothetical protein